MITVGINNHSQVLVTYSRIAVKGEHQGLPFRSINVSVTLLCQQFSLITEMEIGKLKRMMGKFRERYCYIRREKKKLFIFCQDVLFIVNE